MFNLCCRWTGRCIETFWRVSRGCKRLFYVQASIPALQSSDSQVGSGCSKKSAHGLATR